jgi:hypothetical protein
MSISQLANSLTTSYSASNQSSAQATSNTDKVSAGINKSSVKIQTQLDTASTSLSTFGKFKASVSVTQVSAQSLSKFTATSSSDDVKKGLATFITNFNSMVASTQTAAAETSGVQRISRGMTRAMSADLSKITELRNMGFTKASDGTLKLDAAKFDAAYAASPSTVQSTLAKLGQLVDKSANKELASGGSIGNTMDSLTSKSSLLKLQQSVLLKASQQYTSWLQSNTASALNAYKSNQ